MATGDDPAAGEAPSADGTPAGEAVAVVGPLDGAAVPRYAGLPTFARLPRREEAPRFDVAVLGVPFDAGVSYRPGARFGPAHIRQSSRLLRPCNPALEVSPFGAQQVVDAGDLVVNPFNIGQAIGEIEAGARELSEDGLGFATIGCVELDTLGVAGVVERLRARLGDRPVYVSIDIDVLDPAHAPGTGTPEAGGMSSRELLAVLRGLMGGEHRLRRHRRGVTGLRPRRDHRHRRRARRLRAALGARPRLSRLGEPDCAGPAAEPTGLGRRGMELISEPAYRG